MILYVVTVWFGVSSGIKHTVEIIHLSLFGLVLLYLLTTISVALLSLIIFRLWKKLEKADEVGVMPVRLLFFSVRETTVI